MVVISKGWRQAVLVGDGNSSGESQVDEDDEQIQQGRDWSASFDGDVELWSKLGRGKVIDNVSWMKSGFRVADS